MTPLLTPPRLLCRKLTFPEGGLNFKCACAVNVCATFLVIYAVDRWGRRVVLIGGATHMFITQVQLCSMLQSCSRSCLSETAYTFLLKQLSA